MKAERFEDLECWKHGRALANEVYAICRHDRFAKDWGMVDQIRRAAVSIMNNIAEGFERGSNRDFVKFLFIAKGSAGEVRSLLYVAFDQGYITQDEHAALADLATRISRMIWGLIKSLRSKMNWVTGLQATVSGIVMATLLRLCPIFDGKV